MRMVWSNFGPIHNRYKNRYNTVIGTSEFSDVPMFLVVPLERGPSAFKPDPATRQKYAGDSQTLLGPVHL